VIPHEFPLDAFQERALAALERGSSVLVAAPTGAGKTVIAEMAIDRALGRGESAFYASPLKALSNQKYHDFRERYGPERVGILTGDAQENPAAPLLVLTTEILHNRLLCGELGGIREVSCLVLDEFHYLSDPDRGRVWEETIILCPRHVQIVCLSATLPNIGEVADWMKQRVGSVEAIIESHRPVPLSYHYFAGGELRPALTSDSRPDPTLKRYDTRPGRGPAAGIVELMPVLVREQLTPALGFLFSRRDAEKQASMAATWLAEHAPLEAQAERRISAALAAMNQPAPLLPQAQALARCLRQGVGFHHAGVLPELKTLVERLFGEGLLRLLCATETFAMGLNMPARTVALSRISKFDGRAHRELTAREFQQMAGRAGRRGKDDRGHVVVIADPWKPFSNVGQLLIAPLEPVRSAFSFSYNTLINVSSAYGEAAAESILSHSFAVHQLGSAAEGRHRKEMEVMRGALAELGYSGEAPKARLVRSIFNAHALLLAELLDDPRLTPETIVASEFAELTSWFVADGRKPARGPSVKLDARLRQARQLLEDVTARVQRAERHGGRLLTPGVAPLWPNLTLRWCVGEDTGLLCRDYRVAEGDVAVLVDGTRQLLRQIARATREAPAYAILATQAEAALQSLAERTSIAEEEMTA
jgi:superfamily II RNA helicase